MVSTPSWGLGEASLSAISTKWPPRTSPHSGSSPAVWRWFSNSPCAEGVLSAQWLHVPISKPANGGMQSDVPSGATSLL